jgi:hypothetical protein
MNFLDILEQLKSKSVHRRDGRATTLFKIS